MLTVLQEDGNFYHKAQLSCSLAVDSTRSFTQQLIKSRISYLQNEKVLDYQLGVTLS